MTRIEHIRTMTVEEMAETITMNTNFDEEYCKDDCGHEDECPHEEECCIKWLESEMEGE